MPRKKKVKKPIIITDFMNQVINGYVMSDGYLSPSGNLTVDQGREQRKFVAWMLEVLRELCTEGRKITDTTRIREGKLTYSCRFNTRNLLKEYRAVWYPQGKKRLPAEIESMFTPLFITVWYAGDGTKVIGSLGAKIDVNAFTPEERKILQALFLNKYNIPSEINRQGISEKTGEPFWAICINAAAYPAFHKLVTSETDLITKLFPYKLHSLK